MENLVGKKIKGFKYSKKIGYSDLMDKCIGKVGLVEEQSSSFINVRFADSCCSYPIVEAIKHLVQEETQQEKVARLEKELEQAKNELKTNVWIVVYKSTRGGSIYTITYKYAYAVEYFVIGQPDKDGDLVLDIIEKGYSI